MSLYANVFFFVSKRCLTHHIKVKIKLKCLIPPELKIGGVGKEYRMIVTFYINMMSLKVALANSCTYKYGFSFCEVSLCVEGI